MSRQEELYTLAAGEGRNRVQVQGQWFGPDLNLTITGGTHPHMGAVALAQPRPSLKGDGSLSSSTSVLTRVGHKEDELARWAAASLAVRCGCTVVASAGIHVDDASAEEIVHLDQTARSLVTEWGLRFAPAQSHQ